MVSQGCIHKEEGQNIDIKKYFLCYFIKKEILIDVKKKVHTKSAMI